MQKVYKYRSFSSFLYKELFYQELYFASCTELNDPFDLNVPVDFNISDVKQIKALTVPLFHNTLVIAKTITDAERENNTRLVQFTHDKIKVENFNQLVYEHLLKLKGNKPFIYADTAAEALNLAIAESAVNFTFNITKLFVTIERLTKMFLTNSYVTCFSADPLSFLMWSHYAGSHHGVCMEFTLPNDEKFPLEMAGKRQFSLGSVGDGYAEGTTGFYVYEEAILPVNYSDKPLHVNFFDFAPVFLNEHDADLRGLSKSKWHGYANHLQNLFVTKTAPWAYEQDWRMVEVNFARAKEPEDRVQHYPIEMLTAIYIGCNMADASKRRIAKIYNQKGHDLKFLECKLSGDRQLTFEPWEFYEDE
jgi:hypothetical protein